MPGRRRKEEEEEEVISCRLSMVDQALAANPSALGESATHRVKSSFLQSKAGSSSQSSLSSEELGKRHLFGGSYLKHEEGAKEAPALHNSMAPPDLRF